MVNMVKVLRSDTVGNEVVLQAVFHCGPNRIRPVRVPGPEKGAPDLHERV